jgi:hypothetical protein
VSRTIAIFNLIQTNKVEMIEKVEVSGEVAPIILEIIKV